MFTSNFYLRYKTVAAAAGILCLFFSSCSPKISRVTSQNLPPLAKNDEVFLFEMNDTVPHAALRVGTILLDSRGVFSPCTYEEVIRYIESKARKTGGNAIKITRHHPPDSDNQCHRISADIFSIQPQPHLQKITKGLLAGYSTVEPQEIEKPKEVRNRRRFDFYGGYSYTLAPAKKHLPATEYALYQKLRSGYTMGVQIHSFRTRHAAIGLKYTFSQFSATEGSMSGKKRMVGLSPSVLYRRPIAKTQSAMLSGFDFGIQWVSESIDRPLYSDRPKGLTFNAGGLLGLETKINNATALFFGVSCKVDFHENFSGILEPIPFTTPPRFFPTAFLELKAGLSFGPNRKPSL